ncbi:Hypothetical protein GLP15_538 [Giardia lamblia P15]|uniref:Uncharacterized protein n=1 Tax=Giardia intestinalis (strain P15) TaxID=658858 RepID=E1F8I9_GIAIA|nr:Hypothetical protein GLP15_538 [Giardia lamblia P15]
MLHLEMRELLVPQRMPGTHVTLTLTFKNRLRNTVDCEFVHSGSLRRRQTNGSVCTIYPSEVTTPIPWMSHLSHELTVTAEIFNDDIMLYETTIRVAPLKVKHMLSGKRMFLELPMDKISCAAICICKDMTERSAKVFLQNMPLSHIIPLFPEPIIDCYLIVDAGYIIRRSIYDRYTKVIADKIPISLVSKLRRISIVIQGLVGDVVWESMVYNGEVDPRTGEMIMYELINALDAIAINVLSALHKSIFTKNKSRVKPKTSQSSEVRDDRLPTKKTRRQQEKDYKLLLNACMMEGIVAAPNCGANLSRTRGPSLIEVLASINGLSHNNLNPLDLLASYSNCDCSQSTLTLDGLKSLMSETPNMWIIAKQIRNWISVIDRKHILAGLVQNYISPTHLTVPERIGKSQLHDILSDCDDDNVCYVLSIICRDAMTLPRITIGENTYFAPTSSEQVSPYKWLQTSDDSINGLHKFCLHYDIPQKSVCNFLWERLCIADPSSNMADPTAEMVMTKLSFLLTAALNTGTVERWRNGRGKTYSLRSLFIDLIIYIVTTAEIQPLYMLYQDGTNGLEVEVSQVYESEESILCVDPLEEIQQIEQLTSEEYSCPKALLFSRHAQQHLHEVSNSQSGFLSKPSASQSLCVQGETRMLHSLSSEVSLSIADLATDPKNEDYKVTDLIDQTHLPAIPRPTNGVRKQVRAPQEKAGLTSSVSLVSQAASFVFNDMSCQEDDIVLSSIDYTDRSKKSIGRTGVKTAINPVLGSSCSSSVNVSRLNTPVNNLSPSSMPLSLYSNIFVDMIKLIMQERAFTTGQRMLGQCTEDLIEVIVAPTTQFVDPIWGYEQMHAMQDFCIAAAHLKYTMLKLNSCIENVDKEQVKFLIMNILSDRDLEHLLVSLDEPLLFFSSKFTSSTKETQTISSSTLNLPHNFSHESFLPDFSLLREKMSSNDSVIDSILEKATAYVSSLYSNRCTINTASIPSVQHSTDTFISGNTGFARSSSKDTNYLFEPNYESRAGTPDVCQMLGSIENDDCNQQLIEPAIWNHRICPYERQGLMLT